MPNGPKLIKEYSMEKLRHMNHEQLREVRFKLMNKLEKLSIEKEEKIKEILRLQDELENNQ